MAGSKKGKVILISGPAGVGKTTIAARIAQDAGWLMLSEDDAWVKMKEGHPQNEPRTPEEERIVQALTLDTILGAVEAGQNVVLEFILYRKPPLPVIFYRDALIEREIQVDVRLLRATEDEIWMRKQRRGHEWDRDEPQQRGFAKHQLSCLESEYFDAGWIIDSTDKGLEQLYQEHFAGLVANE